MHVSVGTQDVSCPCIYKCECHTVHTALGTWLAVHSEPVTADTPFNVTLLAIRSGALKRVQAPLLYSLKIPIYALAYRKIQYHYLSGLLAL